MHFRPLQQEEIHFGDLNTETHKYAHAESCYIFLNSYSMTVQLEDSFDAEKEKVLTTYDNSTDLFKAS